MDQTARQGDRDTNPLECIDNENLVAENTEDAMVNAIEEFK